VGSGAVFFDLYGSGTLDGRDAWLVDDNPDLIGCYQMVRNQTEDVIAELETLAAGHRAGGEAHYYQVRDERFNPSRAAGGVYTPELAAMLIYLNRTGFNGLFRLNRRGEFNVPAGRYANPRICDAEHLRAVAIVLRDPRVVVERGSFERPLAAAGTGDFIYCDPPYAPLSRTASFANYTARGFSADDQTRLQQAVIAAARRGACVTLPTRALRRSGGYRGRGSARRGADRPTRDGSPRDHLARAAGRSPSSLATNMRANRGKLAVRMLPAVPRAGAGTAPRA
jgi:DNA adenine methylase